MIRIIQQLHWLSLDIAAGAVVLLYFISQAFYVTVPLSVAIALGSAIWIIYSIDHLLDVRTTNRKIAEPRRLFHVNYQNQLVLGISLVLMLNLLNLFFLPSALYMTGFVLVGLCLGYLFVTHWLGGIGMKEVFAAVIYATGIFIYPMIFGVLTMNNYVLFIQLAMLAANNLLLMSYFDYQEDRKLGFGSLVTLLGTTRMKQGLIGLSAISVLISACMLIAETGYVQIQLFYLISAVTLFWILVDPVRFRNGDGFRWVADGLFLLPGLVFVWELIAL